MLGKGSKKSDFKVAYDYFEKGCNLGEPDCCLNQGLLLITKSEKPVIKQDIKKVWYLSFCKRFYYIRYEIIIEMFLFIWINSL